MLVPSSSAEAVLCGVVPSLSGCFSADKDFHHPVELVDPDREGSDGDGKTALVAANGRPIRGRLLPLDDRADRGLVTGDSGPPPGSRLDRAGSASPRESQPSVDRGRPPEGVLVPREGVLPPEHGALAPAKGIPTPMGMVPPPDEGVFSPVSPLPAFGFAITTQRPFSPTTSRIRSPFSVRDTISGLVGDRTPRPEAETLSTEKLAFARTNVERCRGLTSGSENGGGFDGSFSISGCAATPAGSNSDVKLTGCNAKAKAYNT